MSKFVAVTSHKKYSIVIPARDGLPYLGYAVQSALASHSHEVEVLVTVDETGDGSKELLGSMTDKRLRVVDCPPGLSMSEHWDFAQSQAVGEWQIFLGQDDLMMTGYADAFDELTTKASIHELEVIVARRAYVCWPPLQEPGLKTLQYWDTGELTVRDSKEFLTRALLTEISYHAGPQMYTTTLVTKRIVESIRSANEGNLILGHPQDAFLAASLLKASKHFLFSGRPFSWVGTSSKSAGLAISKLGTVSEIAGLGETYAASVEKSISIAYKSNVDFRHGINARYFIDALAKVWPESLEVRPMSSRWFRIRFDSGIWSLASTISHVDFRTQTLLFFNTTRKIAIFLGTWLTFVRGAKTVCIRLISKCLVLLKGGSLGFKSLEHSGNASDLFEAAMAIPTKPLKRMRKFKN
jgi:hypothetical protein